MLFIGFKMEVESNPATKKGFKLGSIAVVIFVIGLVICLTAAGLLVLDVIESGVAGLIGIVGIGLIGLSGSIFASSASKRSQ
jgi:hypothetical protein